nr:hypothetical protein [Zafaria cholistanensis]
MTLSSDPPLSAQGTLPYSGDSPPSLGKLFNNPLVPGLIAANLFFPELLPGLGPAEKWAVMAMPEAAMDHDHGLIPRQDDVRFPRQLLHIDAVAESPAVKTPPDGYFDFRIG